METIKMCGHRREIVGIMVHVMTVPHLTRSAMAAAVVSNDTIAMSEEEQHLRVPVVGRQRPTMAEHNGLTFAPIFVEDFDSIFRFDCGHREYSTPTRVHTSP